jgi:hypothetical protein
MTADIPSVLRKDGDGRPWRRPSVLEKSRTDGRGRQSDGTVENTGNGCTKWLALMAEIVVVEAVPKLYPHMIVGLMRSARFSAALDNTISQVCQM